MGKLDHVKLEDLRYVVDQCEGWSIFSPEDTLFDKLPKRFWQPLVVVYKSDYKNPKATIFGFLNSQSCDHEVLFVIVDTTTNGQLYSIGGILDPTNTDRRLYEAELALEVMIDVQISGRKLTEELLNNAVQA
jgi:hypothetical protein